MKKRNYLLIALLLCICSYAFSQDESEDQLYYFQQYEKSENALKAYLTNILEVNGINRDTVDIIYLNIIPPMGCPRCEGVVVEYNKTLQKQSGGNFIINVAYYSKPAALDEYLTHQNFAGNITFRDSTETLSEIFHANFFVPFITKVSLKAGRLIAGYSSLGINMSKEFVQKIMEENDFKPLVKRNKGNEKSQRPLVVMAHHSANDKSLNFFKMPVDSFCIKDADKIPYVNKFSLNNNAHYLLLDNFLSNSFSLYSLDDNKNFIKKHDYLPTKEEGKMFISKELPPNIFNYLNGMNLLVSMYLNASFIGYDDVYIMASLPKVFMEKSDSDDISIAYMNQPVCLIKNLSGNLSRMILLDSIAIQIAPYALNHPNGVLFAENNTMSFDITKGWPAGGTTAFPESEEDNPFLKDFYNNANSILFYNLENKTVSITAPIDSLYAKYKLGYYLSSPMVKYINGAYYWVDQHIGKVYKFSQDFKNQELVFDLFNLKKELKQLPFTENLAYIESYDDYFYRAVLDFNISPDGLLTALVSDDGDYRYYYEVNKKGKLNITPFFVRDFSKITTLRFGQNSKNYQVVYALCQNNQKMIIYKFQL